MAVKNVKKGHGTSQLTCYQKSPAKTDCKVYYFLFEIDCLYESKGTRMHSACSILHIFTVLSALQEMT